jgi:hypothetical protein
MKNIIDITTQMEFDKGYGKYGPCEGKRLNHHWIFRSLFLTCARRFQENLERVDWSKKQSSQTLFDSPDWKRMKVGTRIAIGRILRYFVDNGWLPLRVTNLKVRGTKYYERIKLDTEARSDSLQFDTSTSNQPN